MKISDDDFSALKSTVSPLDTSEARSAYQRRDFPRAELCRDVDKRYRWDLLHASRFPVTSLYSYLDDTHIDTALRNIVRPLEG